jgi:hypothetical protein
MNAPTNRPVSPLLKADPKATLTFSAEKDGLMRVTYQGWEDAKVLKPGEWIEVVNRGGQLQVFRRGEPLVEPAPLAAGTPLAATGAVDQNTPLEPIGE